MLRGVEQGAQLVAVAQPLRCPAACIAPTGMLTAPGMWPSRRVLPSKPWYSAGARASSSGHVGRAEQAADVGGRQVQPVRAAGVNDTGGAQAHVDRGAR